MRGRLCAIGMCVHLSVPVEEQPKHSLTHTELLKASLCLRGLHNDSMTACQTSYEIDSMQPKLPSPSLRHHPYPLATPLSYLLLSYKKAHLVLSWANKAQEKYKTQTEDVQVQGNTVSATFGEEVHSY